MDKIYYKKGYKYKIITEYSVDIKLLGYDIETQFIELDKFGELIILVGYCYDGASCAVDTKSFMRGSLVHDALYQLIREGHLPKSTREKCDKILIEICKEDGMSWLRRKYVYKAVRKFGGSAVKPREIFVAP